LSRGDIESRASIGSRGIIGRLNLVEPGLCERNVERKRERAAVVRGGTDGHVIECDGNGWKNRTVALSGRETISSYGHECTDGPTTGIEGESGT